LEKEGRSEEKMRTIAVICEYNPFHEGHQYLIERARALYPEEETAIVCVMSGDFVQRGEPAIYDKYSRAERALRGGADLVLELPTPYSCSVAEHFASAAISIICRLGVVDDLAFGSEGKDEEALFVYESLTCHLGIGIAHLCIIKVSVSSFVLSGIDVSGKVFGDIAIKHCSENIRLKVPFCYVTCVNEIGCNFIYCAEEFLTFCVSFDI
jgi:cytidyltransferase-like protein